MKAFFTLVLLAAWFGTAHIVTGALHDYRHPAQRDTVVIKTVQYDTVTVIARARDTVRITEIKVGPLTSRRLARLVCGPNLTYGDQRDAFGYNALGMVFCPHKP